MKIILDTNVFISGIFWSGPPYQILKAWQKQRIELDDKFIACALSAKVKIIVSGDQDLLSVSGYQDINIMKPGSFVKQNHF